MIGLAKRERERDRERNVGWISPRKGHRRCTVFFSFVFVRSCCVRWMQA